MATGEIKVMYLAPLVVGRTHPEFRARWRQHADLAMGLGFWKYMSRYKQCDVLTAGEEGLPEDLLAHFRTADYGGVGQIYFHDAEALGATLSETDDVQTMCVDEVPTFGRELGVNLTGVVQSEVIPGAPGPITVIGAVHRVAGMDRETFSKKWLELGQEVARRPELASRVNRYVHNDAFPEAEYCDGFVELSFADVDNLLAFMGAMQESGLAEAENEFMDRSKMEAVITRETLLYDVVD
ncbi:unannotated protein [freshwater metagenome]|uniref:Unannotated protein n=1 Tax=freshwater metagenome TaxID=449393 RepID=A0A6J7JE41_9ZZZZ|nr:hypothetical protein [Actinomycetota bacterium]